MSRVTILLFLSFSFVTTLCYERSSLFPVLEHEVDNMTNALRTRMTPMRAKRWAKTKEALQKHWDQRRREANMPPEELKALEASRRWKNQVARMMKTGRVEAIPAFDSISGVTGFKFEFDRNWSKDVLQFDSLRVSQNGSNTLNSGYVIDFAQPEGLEGIKSIFGKDDPDESLYRWGECVITMVVELEKCPFEDEAEECYGGITNAHCVHPEILKLLDQNADISEMPLIYLSVYSSYNDVRNEDEIGHIFDWQLDNKHGDVLLFLIKNTSLARDAHLRSSTIGSFADYKWIDMEEMHLHPMVSKIGPATGWTDGVFIGSMYDIVSDRSARGEHQFDNLATNLNFSGVICNNDASGFSDRGDCGALIFNKEQKLIYGQVGGTVDLNGMGCTWFTPISQTFDSLRDVKNPLERFVKPREVVLDQYSEQMTEKQMDLIKFIVVCISVTVFSIASMWIFRRSIRSALCPRGTAPVTGAHSVDETISLVSSTQ